MNKISKLFLVLSPALILTSCGGDSAAPQASLSESEHIEGSETKTEPTVKKIGNFEFIKGRTTNLELDSRGEIVNFEAYKKSLNLRVITVTTDNDALENGTLKCVDLTNPIKPISNEVHFEKDGLNAKLQVYLSDSNKTEHSYECGVYENNNLLESSQVNFTFYSDLLVDSTMKYNQLGFSANSINKFGAIILTEKAVVVSDGIDLSIDAEEIISLRGSKIMTFTNSENLASEKGQNGGLINIKTNLVTGVMNVELRGKNGGKMTKRPEKPSEYPSFYRPGMLDGVAEVSSMQDVCRPGRDEDDRDYCQPEEVIEVWPTSGRNGYSGLKGYQGFTGFKGGDSGIFKLMTRKSDQFFIKVKLFPGKGGAGGAGGEGGNGTPGGQISCRFHCSGISAGSSGPNGSQGDVGLDGSNGATQYAELIDLTDGFRNRMFIDESTEKN